MMQTVYVPRSNRNHRHEFNQKHIPGVSFFDLKKCCDQSSKYDNIQLTASDFSHYVGDLGIGNDTSSFGYFMFRVFGHPELGG
ncbi:hypothetical protein CCH79_00013676 [Gambusia affinis]|uniref:Uncharacterized protein n=1 Tax=Gambusia affinis TaxID=33528 RepID=A0A315WXD1_GAMAF|nr:hypothetical protein CCH79_00013676 [Gambusia affinis]